MRWVGWLLAIIISLYLALLAYLFAEQRSFLYFPDEKQVLPAASGLPDYKAVKIGTSTSWWRPPATADAPIIIHFHGNGGGIAGRGYIYSALAGKDFGILAAEYPGYGGNRGKPTEGALFASAQAAYNWVVAQGYPPQRIVIVGQSLGTGVAVWLASRNRAAGLMLEAPYRSMTEMAGNRMPFVPARLLLLDQYDSASRIDRVRMPVAWVHGGRDTLIPVTIGQSLFDAAKTEKCSHIIAEAGHNNLWDYDISTFFRANAQAMVSEGKCLQIP